MTDNARIVREALEESIQAFEFTRQYIGYEMLPAIKGWSWFDAVQKIESAIPVLTTLETELATAQADLERAREEGEVMRDALMEDYRQMKRWGAQWAEERSKVIWKIIGPSRAALAPEQKG